MATQRVYDKSHCLVETCQREYYTKGYCRPHYKRAAAGKPLDVEKPELPTYCSQPGCGRVRLAKGLCQPHYVRQSRGKSFATPIGFREACSVEGCDEREHSQTLCRSHYAEKRRRDNPRYCTVAGCLRRGVVDGLCDLHYRRQRRGMSLESKISARRTSAEILIRDAEGNKYCPKCEDWLAEDCFRPRSRSSDGLACYCMVCTDWSTSLGKYGLTTETYIALVNAQGDSCAICGTDNPGGKWNKWCVDHDHSCCPGQKTCGNCVRGLLCIRCNTGLGMFADNIYNMQSAISYLNGDTNGV